jgi:hypothetical protein
MKCIYCGNECGKCVVKNKECIDTGNYCKKIGFCGKECYNAMPRKHRRKIEWNNYFKDFFMEVDKKRKIIS